MVVYISWGSCGELGLWNPKFLTRSRTFHHNVLETFQKVMHHRCIAFPLPLTDGPASVRDTCTPIPHLYTCPHTMCYPCVPQILKASQGHSLVKSHAEDDTMQRLCQVPWASPCPELQAEGPPGGSLAFQFQGWNGHQAGGR